MQKEENTNATSPSINHHNILQTINPTVQTKFGQKS